MHGKWKPWTYDDRMYANKKTELIQEIKNTIFNNTEWKFFDKITNAYSEKQLKRINKTIKDSRGPPPRW